jgi:hypothetical protein
MFASLAVQWCPYLVVRHQGLHSQARLQPSTAIIGRGTRAVRPFPGRRSFNTVKHWCQQRAYYSAIDRFYFQETVDYTQWFAARVPMFCDQANERHINTGDAMFANIYADPSRAYLLQWHADAIAAAANRLPAPPGWFTADGRRAPRPRALWRLWRYG